MQRPLEAVPKHYFRAFLHSNFRIAEDKLLGKGELQIRPLRCELILSTKPNRYLWY